MTLHLCKSSLVIFTLVFLLFYVLSVLRLAAASDARNRLRLQKNTRREVEKALKNNALSTEAAERIMFHPEFGVDPAEHSETENPTQENRAWQNRKLARRGWEATVLIMWSVVGVVLGSLLLFLVFTGGLSFLTILERLWPEVFWMTIFILFILALLYFFLRFTWRVFKTTRQMMKYH